MCKAISGQDTVGGEILINQARNEKGLVSSFYLNFEQHASVSPIEEFGMNNMGYNIVNVAQKLTLNFSNSGLTISTYTDIFPSATLSLNGVQIMRYRQPSFKKNYQAPILNYSISSLKDNVIGGRPTYDIFYRPANWYKR